MHGCFEDNHRITQGGFLPALDVRFQISIVALVDAAFQPGRIHTKGNSLYSNSTDKGKWASVLVLLVFPDFALCT